VAAPAGLQAIAEIVLVAVPIVAAIVFHEVAHGAVAYLFGDPTAAQHGRLTLNPLPHVDPVGTILVPGFLLLAPYLLGTQGFGIIGWARPVPVDFRRLNRLQAILVALAGPATNLLLAAASALVLAWLPSEPSSTLVQALGRVAIASLTVNCVLAVFNLIPIPPLDGSRVITALLPARAARALWMVERAGFVVLLLVVFNTDILSRLVRPVLLFFVELAR
jgi:Zn-dependent protease